MKKNIDNLRYLAAILWKFDKYIFLLFLCSILTGAIVPYIGILLPKFVLRALLSHADIEYWIKLFLLFGLGGTCLSVLDAWLLNMFKAHISAARNGCFGQMLTEKMLKMEYSLLEQPSVQELCYRANFLFWSDNSGMAGVFDGLRVMLSGLFTLGGLAIILARLSPILPFLLCILFLVSFVSLLSARKKENTLRDEMSAAEREKEYLDSLMCDITAGKDIRLYGMTGWLSGWYRKTGKRSEQTVSTVRKGYTKAELCAAATSLLRDAAAYTYLLRRVLSKSFLIDDFVMYIGAITGFTSNLVTVVDKFLGVRQFLENADDFRKAMSLEDDNMAEMQESVTNFRRISLNNIFFRYPQSDTDALKGINLTVSRGEHIAIVGLNGAGKTTLIKLLTGLYSPLSGEVEIYYDKNYHDEGKYASNQKHYKLFSVVMQKVFQYAFTLEENITFQAHEDVNQLKLKRAVEWAGLSEDIEKMPNGLNTLLRKDYDPNGITLSGGQTQKLALARALYRDAPVVILDEPSSALDPIAEYTMYENFNRLLKDKTCIFISHRLSSVRFCNRVVLLDKGCIAGIGSHEQLVRENSLYAELWNAQSKPYQKDQL